MSMTKHASWGPSMHVEVQLDGHSVLIERSVFVALLENSVANGRAGFHHALGDGSIKFSKLVDLARTADIPCQGEEIGQEIQRSAFCDDVRATRFVGEPVSGDAELRREKRCAHRVVFVDEFERIGQHGELRMPGREVRDEGALTAGVGSGYDDAHGDDDTAGPP